MMTVIEEYNNRVECKVNFYFLYLHVKTTLKDLEEALGKETMA